MAQKIPVNMARIMDRAKVDFTILGGEEWCCGFPLILAGMRDAAIELMRHNVETIRAMGARAAPIAAAVSNRGAARNCCAS